MRGGQRLRRMSGAPRPLNYGWKNKCGRTGCGCPGEYNGYRRWEKKSSKRVRSERSRENYAIFRNRKRAKGRKPTEKAREPGM